MATAAEAALAVEQAYQNSPLDTGGTIGMHSELPDGRVVCSKCNSFYRVGDRHGCTLRLSNLPEVRKGMPIARGVLDYFPLALAEVARISKAGNDQHNPGQPMHWAREKSSDHADCIVRHLIERGRIDSDGQRHSAKMAWRALALLQLEMEASI